MKTTYIDLSGDWNIYVEGLGSYVGKLPGTLDTNKIGFPDQIDLETRLTRLFIYEGEAKYSKKIRVPQIVDQHIFLEVERTRQLRLKIKGEEILPLKEGTLSTPYLFTLTPYAGEEIDVELICDNSYKSWSRKSIIGSSAATDETQTNWNGLLGNIRLSIEPQIYLDNILVHPKGNILEIKITLGGEVGHKEKLRLSSQVFNEDVVVEKKSGESLIELTIPLKENILKWDEEEGNLYHLLVKILDEKTSQIIHEKEEIFGVRDFAINEKKRLTINGRVFFLRGEANCCVFPETGHPPMEVKEWKQVLATYASYGVNCMRFHSWCPPKAAFIAADEIGMMMQPELSHWNCKDAFDEEESITYYRRELEEILAYYGNHPSFVMLTFGNELHGDEEGHKEMDRLLDLAKSLDQTRLFANGSNVHYGEIGIDEKSDFYTSMAYYNEILRATSSPMIGHLNEAYPNGKHNYEEAARKIIELGKPVFGFEVGQYEVLPEFSEIDQFHGVTRPINFIKIKEKVEETGDLELWNQMVEATGELSLLGYREEIEGLLRTPSMSGLSLLGLQDFPGQGTAIVGMLNSHLQPKPYSFAKPERFKRFFTSVLPLVYLDKYTFYEGENLQAKVMLAHYGKEDIKGSGSWKLKQNDKVIEQGYFKETKFIQGELNLVGEINTLLPMVSKACEFELEVKVEKYKNTYPIWIYKKQEDYIDFANKNDILLLNTLSQKEEEEIKEGKVGFLELDFSSKEPYHKTIGGQFTTDFWSVGTFPAQEGGMGMLIDDTHPIFSDFPTKKYSQWQWWKMASGRPMILDREIKPIIRVPDSYSRLKYMGLLYEKRIGKGCLIVSSMDLKNNLHLPECNALLGSILIYASKQKKGNLL